MLLRNTEAADAMDEGRNPWTTLSREVCYENRWIRVWHHDVLTPAGRQGVYGVVEFRSTAVGVVPVDDDGCTWLVGQYRYPLDRFSWEIPEGGAAPDADPAAEALRELEEETGLAAGHVTELMRMHLSNSVTTESAVAFVAWGLAQGDSAPEETEELSVRRVPLREAFEMAMDGRITDSLSIAALMKLRLLHDAGSLPEDLARRVAEGFAAV